MTGSGNDFVVFDVREGRPHPGRSLAEPSLVREICARGTGVGADGVVILDASPSATARMAYFNSDGSRAALCGNAALCTTRLLSERGGDPSALSFETDAGLIHGRIADGAPEIDLSPVDGLRAGAGVQLAAGELAIGYVVAGVPHLVVAVADVGTVDVRGRGRELRFDPAFAGGANVNFVSPGAGGRWAIRTYERGVEGETLACGTGAVAAAAVLVAWGRAAEPVALETRSGRILSVRSWAREGRSGPSLQGEGRIVFRGELVGERLF